MDARGAAAPAGPRCQTPRCTNFANPALLGGVCNRCAQLGADFARVIAEAQAPARSRDSSRSPSPARGALAYDRGFAAAAPPLDGVPAYARTATPAHIEANMRVESAPPLTDAELATLDAMNEAHPYYWSPMPLLPPGSAKDL